ncbi:hypothetical protein ACO0LF_15375 [Undibacterium sp. Di27W]|uniref:hypothetical protein n=1 Tax=Undibacterium sp. Di27W TaxID=3413036 RepID=UPI003BF2230A
MAGRKQIKNLAAGLASSFNSRNNDLAGYWAIGKLCSFALAQSVTVIQLDVLNIACMPASTAFDAVMHDYRVKLAARMTRQELPPSWLEKVEIVINFLPDHDKDMDYFRYGSGNPYIVTVNLTTDLGEQYSSKAGGKCHPHDPLRESKRA